MYTFGPLSLKSEAFDLDTYKNIQRRISEIIYFHKRTQTYYFPDNKHDIHLSTGLFTGILINFYLRPNIVRLIISFRKWL